LENNYPSLLKEEEIVLFIICTNSLYLLARERHFTCKNKLGGLPTDIKKRSAMTKSEI
jgi:hypothetical protein